MTKQREIHTGDMATTQKPDVDLTLGGTIIHGEALPNIAQEQELMASHNALLAFGEEPMHIRIEDNSQADFPETHVQVLVQGENAEVFQNGRWLKIGWLPIGVELITKRKYVEVLARSRIDSIRTVHDDATVERPRNTIRRATKAQYPLSIIQDNNPMGREWLSRIMMGH